MDSTYVLVDETIKSKDYSAFYFSNKEKSFIVGGYFVSAICSLICLYAGIDIPHEIPALIMVAGSSVMVSSTEFAVNNPQTMFLYPTTGALLPYFLKILNGIVAPPLFSDFSSFLISCFCITNTNVVISSGYDFVKPVPLWAPCLTFWSCPWFLNSIIFYNQNCASALLTHKFEVAVVDAAAHTAAQTVFADIFSSSRVNLVQALNIALINIASQSHTIAVATQLVASHHVPMITAANLAANIEAAVSVPVPVVEILPVPRETPNYVLLSVLTAINFHAPNAVFWPWIYYNAAINAVLPVAMSTAIETAALPPLYVSLMSPYTIINISVSITVASVASFLILFF